MPIDYSRSPSAQRLRLATYASQQRIIGWTFEADTHCTECTCKRFGADIVMDDTARDREGNSVHPIFTWQSEVTEYCGDCHREL
jgi:hypothetical protein